MFKESLLVLISTPTYAILILLELLLSHRWHQKLYSWRETLTNVYLMLLNMGLDVLLRGLVAFVLLYFYAWGGLQWDKTWLYWLALFLAEDFAFYWLHRIDHDCRLFWAVHVTHHSSEEFNLTTGFRSSVFQPVYRVIYFIPLALVGFDPLDIFLMYSITQIYGILVHTQLIDKLGFLEYILVTPSHHRVHHASNVPYLDKNLGMCLIFWDKLFGTFAAEDPAEPVRYGLTRPLPQRDAVNIVFHEWKSIAADWQRAQNWRERLGYVFQAPGWSPDGSSKTAKELQKEWGTGK